MAEAFYRLKSAGGAWTRVTGTAPITVTGLTEGAVYEYLRGDGTIGEVTAGVDNAAPIISNLVIDDTTDPLGITFDVNEDADAYGIWTVDNEQASITAQNIIDGVLQDGTTPADLAFGPQAITTPSGSFTDDISSLADGTVRLYLTAQDASSNQTTPLSDSFVRDTTAPTLSSAALASDGVTLTLTYDEALAGTASAGDYTVEADASAVTVSTATRAGSTVVLDLGSTVFDGQTVTVSYSGTAITDGAGNQAGTLTDEAVTNNSTQSDPNAFATKLSGNNASFSGPAHPTGTVSITFRLDTEIATGTQGNFDILGFVSDVTRLQLDSRSGQRGITFRIEDSNENAIVIPTSSVGAVPTSRCEIIAVATHDRGDGTAEAKIFVDSVEVASATAPTTTGIFPDFRDLKMFSTFGADMKLYEMELWYDEYSDTGDVSGYGSPAHAVSGDTANWNAPTDTGTRSGLTKAGDPFT